MVSSDVSSPKCSLLSQISEYEPQLEVSHNCELENPARVSDVHLSL